MKAETTFAEFERSKKGGAAKSKRGKIRNARVEPGDGGFMVHASYHPKDGGGPMSMMDDQVMNPKPKIAKDHTEMVNHISKMFGGPQFVPAGAQREAEDEASGATNNAATKPVPDKS